MSAHSDIALLARRAGVPAAEADTGASQILNTHRAEVLHEVIDRLANRATLYGDSRTVNAVLRDLDQLAAGGAS